MKSNIKSKHYTTWFRIRAILLCVLTIICVCCTSIAVIAETMPSDPREQTKARIMWRIQNQGWDPYSADMTLEEFYALMELFNEGKIQIEKDDNNTDKTPSQPPSNRVDGPIFGGVGIVGAGIAGAVNGFGTAGTNGLYNNETDDDETIATNVIRREKFLYAGISDDYKGQNSPLEYNNENDYEPYDPYTNKPYTVDENDSKKFVLNNKTYVLDETDGRLYNMEAMARYTKVKGIFRVDGGVYVAWGFDGNLYEFDGTEYSLADEASATSLNDTVYKWRNNTFYNEKTGEEYNESGEYYYNKGLKQAYEWRNGAMYIAGMGILVDSEVIKNLAYYYPAGLDPERIGYKRPSNDWTGIELNDNMQAIVLTKEENKGEIGGYADQTLFQKLDGYYVKNVTINGIAVTILGMIKVTESGDDRYVYYYMSSDEQNTQVSATMLPDAQKFVVEYVPIEHAIEYRVEMATPNGDGTYNYKDVTDEWENTLFGKNRPLRTTDGAYAFNVVAPYGYETAMILKHTVTIDIADKNGKGYSGKPDITKAVLANVEEAYAGTRTFGKATAEESKNILLNAYEKFLQENGIDTFNRSSAEFTEDNNGNYTANYSASGPDAEAHGKVLDRIAERMSKHILLNDGYALGTEPVYEIKNDMAVPSLDKGPTTHTVNATFYNNLVRENRTVVAVLKRNVSAPVFNAVNYIQNSGNTGRGDRGASAYTMYSGDANSYKTLYGKNWYDYEKEFVYLRDNDKTNGNPLGNVRPYDGWNWQGNSKTQLGPDNPIYAPMVEELDQKGNGLGTYYWQWTFQTNSGDFFFDTLAINGKSSTIPFAPKYATSGNIDTAVRESGVGGWKSTSTLPDGAQVTMEFLVQFGTQRVYRLTIEHAKSNVSITNMNLMMYGGGAPEIAVYELVGIYAPDGTHTSELEPAIQTYNGGWKRGNLGDVLVNQAGGEYIDYQNGNPDLYGANLRFKAIEGYGNPYFLFENSKGAVINGQSSATRNLDGSIASHNNITYLSEFKKTGLKSLEKGVVYKDDTNDEGWYYIRLENPDFKMSMLTVIARPARYMVYYNPYYIWDWENTGSIDPVRFEGNDEYIDSEGWVVPGSMPSFPHYNIYGDFLYSDTYDDNNGFYYDSIKNNTVALPTTSSGIIRPVDPSGKYNFSGWVVADYSGASPQPQTDDENKLILHTSRAISLVELNDYAVLNPDFGPDDTDVYVITLVPAWSKVENPFYYDVYLYWVDAQGILHEYGFHNGWNEVLTESPMEGQYVYVYLNKVAGPLLDWIAQNPTYTFWDEVNNALDDATIKTALDKYLRIGEENGGRNESDYEEYDSILYALTNRDRYKDDSKGDDEQINDFERLGFDHFAVLESHGIISIWMYENKGGLVFHKEVEKEPFTPDDEFYFTVTDVTPANTHARLNGVYKAYPEAQFYDSKGNKYIEDSDGEIIYENGVLISKDKDGNPVRVRLINDSDAWIVTFKGGNIERIEKNGEITTYFTLKHGEGIELYVPSGNYTIVELGSKSGGSYQANITYTASDGSIAPENSVILPSGNTWVRGSNKEVLTGDGALQQISAEVSFEIGAVNVVKILTFHNKTTSLSIEKFLDALDEVKKDPGIPKSYKDDAVFTINVELQMPVVRDEDDNEVQLTPIKKTDDSGKDIYYFLANFYTVEYIENRNGTLREKLTFAKQQEIEFTQDEKGRWCTTFHLKAGDRVVIVMTADYGMVNYWIKEETTPYNGGYVYKKLINDDFKHPQFDGYAYYKTLEDAQKAHAGVPVKGGEGYVDGETIEWIEEATLSGMYLTPLISPNSGKAQAGKKAVVKVVNWFGELPGYGYLAITAKNGDPNESFLFRITGSDVSLIVSVKGGETTYVYARCGSYTIEEITDWAWRYEEGMGTVTDPTLEPDEENADGDENTAPTSDPLNVIITLANDSRKNAVHAEYSHDLNNKCWLGVEKSGQVFFTPSKESTE